MKRILTILCVLALTVSANAAKNHPTLLITKERVSEMKRGMGKYPLFDKSVEDLISDAQKALERPTCVPTPKDAGGGYTHETHKLNYYDMNNLGVAFQLTGDKKYSEKVREILLAYCDAYPTWGLHPVTTSPVRGKVFWQTLNESVWLLHTSMAYDCVRSALNSKDRKRIESELLTPWAEFIMNGTEANAKTFDRMTNHATWAVSAVGMAGMAMDNEDLVKKSLYGSDLSGKNGGFLMQLDHLFSPDGYFTEGAYYHRYAIWPFVMYAQCIDNYLPDLKIFGYRDSIIVKSLGVLLQQAYNGEFMHFNDAMEKGYWAQEILYALDIVYKANPENKQLLSVAADHQGKVIVSDAGFAVARDIAKGEAQPFEFHSCLLHDGKDGKDGAFAILRHDNAAVTFKATSHGLSHGHYDKLTYAYYDLGNEIITDYGASRFHNIEAKSGGNYTPQNKTYSMTTIAHNTLVVDKCSHYNGNIRESEKHSPRVVAFEAGNPALQYVSAVDSTAYDGVRMQRWIGYIEVPFLERPLLVDVLKVDSEDQHNYDLPLQFNGQMISLSEPFKTAGSEMKTLGQGHGYQHLWVEAEARGGKDHTTFTWMTGHKMYSYTAVTTENTEIKFLRAGANDPEFNIRREPSFLLREPAAGNHIFASCVETHGKYDLALEQVDNLEASCEGIEIFRGKSENISVQYRFKGGKTINVTITPSTGKMIVNN